MKGTDVKQKDRRKLLVVIKFSSCGNKIFIWHNPLQTENQIFYIGYILHLFFVLLIKDIIPIS